jgi:predicted RNase H-like HicB family nuclease
MTLNVILERTSTNWCAFTPDDIGVVFSTAAARDEVIDNFRVALKARLDAMKADGIPVPHIDKLNIQELVAI